ncbi:PIN domain-containing protein [Hymenobacter terrestris]|uniref:PIN domain-containing protein n=1 Tax=Hymenobacter terrestris TaxID=2748310 RepID=A0ABX2Q6F7_9BACT|nr:PIN domain-containing protein [Hymenobacter terrestris]NVO86553.1 PIN domain-containing protein [Hymenobacter terrestris]
MAGLVCVDSMFCIWSIKEECREGQEHMIERAKQILVNLQRAKKQLMLPAPVITELLAPVGAERSTEIMQQLTLIFPRIAVVDTPVAALCGKIWNAEGQSWKELYEPGTTSLKVAFKYDLLILGTAIINKAECLYTGDKRLANLARKYGNQMKVVDLWKDEEFNSTSTVFPQLGIPFTSARKGISPTPPIGKLITGSPPTQI